MPANAENITTPVEFEEAVGVRQLPDIDYTRRITFGRLVAVTAASLDLPPDYASPIDLERSRPATLVGGLYIRRQDPRHGNARLTFAEVVFPSQEFPPIARSPHDLAEQMYGQNHKKNKAMSDRDERHATAMRAAGHTLEGKLVYLAGYQAQLSARSRLLTSLTSELDNTSNPWIAHWKARNLEAARAEADRAIHETAEVASVNLGWDDVAVRGLHRAIKSVLYRPDRDQAKQRAGWRAYLKMVRDHTAAKAQLAERAYKGCGKELETYRPFLDAEGKLF